MYMSSARAERRAECEEGFEADAGLRSLVRLWAAVRSAPVSASRRLLTLVVRRRGNGFGYGSVVGAPARSANLLPNANITY